MRFLSPKSFGAFFRDFAAHFAINSARTLFSARNNGINFGHIKEKVYLCSQIS